jgi:hypothetical protein
MKQKATPRSTLPSCAITPLSLTIDDLLEEGAGYRNPEIIKPSITKALTRMRQQTIRQLVPASPQLKKELLINIRTGLVNAEDEINHHIRLLRGRETCTSPYHAALQQISQMRLYIERRWAAYCTQDIKESDKTLSEIRISLFKRFAALKKNFSLLDQPLYQVLLEPVQHFMSPRNIQPVTRATVQYMLQLFSDLEQLVASNNRNTVPEGTDLTRILLSKNFNTILFATYYQAQLADQAEKLPGTKAKIAFLDAARAEIIYLSPAAGAFLADAPSLAATLVPWINNLAELLQKQEEAKASLKEGSPELETLVKLIYKECGGVVAEFYNMLLESGFCLNTELCHVMQTVATCGETPNSRTPSGGYLLKELKKKDKRFRDIILRYLPKFKKYLESA